MSIEASAELIERAKNDREAFGEIYDIYIKRIYSFAASHSRNRHEAEDLTSATFERGLRSIGGYRDQGLPFSRWLYRIAANLAIDRARAIRGVVMVPEDSAPVGSLISTDASTSDVVEQWERAWELAGSVERLPQEQQAALRLRFWSQRSFVEIGVATGRSEQAAKQLVYRAIRALRLEMAGMEADHA